MVTDKPSGSRNFKWLDRLLATLIWVAVAAGVFSFVRQPYERLARFKASTGCVAGVQGTRTDTPCTAVSRTVLQAEEHTGKINYYSVLINDPRSDTPTELELEDRFPVADNALLMKSLHHGDKVEAVRWQGRIVEIRAHGYRGATDNSPENDIPLNAWFLKIMAIGLPLGLVLAVVIVRLSKASKSSTTP
jgi:hypothetical protein